MRTKDLITKRKSGNKEKEKNTIMWYHQDRCSVITSFIVFSKLPSSQNDNFKNNFI